MLHPESYGNIRPRIDKKRTFEAWHHEALQMNFPEYELFANRQIWSARGSRKSQLCFHMWDLSKLLAKNKPVSSLQFLLVKAFMHTWEYLNSCSTSLTTVPQSPHLNEPNKSSGRTSDVRVTVPEIATKCP
jgi:hypothetical protein